MAHLKTVFKSVSFVLNKTIDDVIIFQYFLFTILKMVLAPPPMPRLPHRCTQHLTREQIYKSDNPPQVSATSYKGILAKATLILIVGTEVAATHHFIQ